MLIYSLKNEYNLLRDYIIDIIQLIYSKYFNHLLLIRPLSIRLGLQ